MDPLNINNLLNSSLNEDGAKIDLLALFEQKAKANGISVNQARERLKIEHRSLMSILTGEAKHPNLINILKIAEFLEISLDDMVKSILSKQRSENIASLQTAN